MKRIFQVLLLTTFVTVTGYAQSFYAGVSSGLALGAFPSKVQGFINVKNDDTDVSIQQPGFSLGGGFNIDLKAGYFINDYLGFDLKMRLHHGSKVKFHQETMIMSVMKYNDIELFGNRTILIPSLIIKAGGDMKLTPYVNIGPSFGFIKQVMNEHIEIDTNTGDKHWEYSGEMMIGVNVESGILYNVSEVVFINLSFTVSNMIYSPQRLDLTMYSYNSKNNLYNLNVSEKEKVFQEWTGDPFNSSPDPAKPEPLQKQQFSYNNLSVELGVYLVF